jgi:hypothetical protein
VAQPPPDYGVQFVGTWAGPWYICPAQTCGGTSGNTAVQLGTWTTVITESGTNNLLLNDTFTDNSATSVTCTNGYVVTAGPGNPSIVNLADNSPSVGTLAFTGTYSCVATGVAGCGGTDLNVTFTAAGGALFADGTMGIEFQVTQSCAGGSQVVYYIIQPLVKQ